MENEMTKFKIYQINLSDDEYNEVNRGNEDLPKFVASRNAMFGDEYKADNWKFYEHVSDIEADDLNGVFHIGNMGPEERITRHAPMHSLSVGDIIVDPRSGNRSIVARCGFTDIQ